MTTVTTNVCAYCGSTDRLTREHLWPRALHRRLVEAGEEKKSRIWLAKIKKEVAGEPTVRDVCAECNNGELSRLDDYICELFDRAFTHVPARYAKVEFQYDYHRLKRWLLKMCFNCARIHVSGDMFVFPPLLPYIMGRSNALGRSIQLYVQLVYPSEIPTEFLEPTDPKPSIYYPTMNRVGYLWFNIEGVGRKMLRSVHLQSFSFYLAFYENDRVRAMKEDLCKDIFETDACDGPSASISQQGVASL
jgi:hypothetical protein